MFESEWINMPVMESGVPGGKGYSFLVLWSVKTMVFSGSMRCKRVLTPLLRRRDSLIHAVKKESCSSVASGGIFFGLGMAVRSSSFKRWRRGGSERRENVA